MEFAGVRVYEVPPNGQGIAALLALNILKELGVVEEARATVAKSGAAAAAATAKDGGEAAYLHRLIEVLRLAFADTRWYCADMDKAEVPVKELLGHAYAAERARLFDPTRYSRRLDATAATSQFHAITRYQYDVDYVAPACKVFVRLLQCGLKWIGRRNSCHECGSP